MEDLETKENVRVNRLSRISGYSEPCVVIDNDNDQSALSECNMTSININDDNNIEYYLLDDSPMARFARSVKWSYQKVSNIY